jgi:predicted ATP-dependent endonuclease of OLD family
VEGVTDRIIVESSAEALGIDLDGQSVALLDIMGAGSIYPIWQMYGPGGFEVPFFGLVDADRKDDWAKAMAIAAGSLPSAGVEVCDPDLEGVFVSTLGSERILELLIEGGVEEPTIRSDCGQSSGVIPEPDLVKWARDHKKEFAAAIALTMARSDAERITPISRLLKAVSE